MGTLLSSFFITKQSFEFRISPSTLSFLGEGKSSILLNEVFFFFYWFFLQNHETVPPHELALLVGRV